MDSFPHVKTQTANNISSWLSAVWILAKFENSCLPSKYSDESFPQSIHYKAFLGLHHFLTLLLNCGKQNSKKRSSRSNSFNSSWVSSVIFPALPKSLLLLQTPRPCSLSHSISGHHWLNFYWQLFISSEVSALQVRALSILHSPCSLLLDAFSNMWLHWKSRYCFELSSSLDPDNFTLKTISLLATSPHLVPSANFPH